MTSRTLRCHECGLHLPPGKGWLVQIEVAGHEHWLRVCDECRAWLRVWAERERGPLQEAATAERSSA